MHENSFEPKRIPISILVPIHEPDPLQPLIPEPYVPDDIPADNDDYNLLVDRLKRSWR